jgi:hypothetical protein
MSNGKGPMSIPPGQYYLSATLRNKNGIGDRRGQRRMDGS